MKPPPEDGRETGLRGIFGLDSDKEVFGRVRSLRRADLPTERFSPEDELVTRRMLPVRYSIKEDESGRYLSCVDAPNISVRLESGFSVTASAARKHPECTIFVDGAAQSEPFMDVQRRVYNLDHHEGCVRAFTLASCEQAMVVVLKGLDLGGEQWNVYGNEPDLDTVLAVWVLLNHRRITGESSPTRTKIMPIVRLQGVIDAHGFELKELTAFPEDLQRETLEVINRLRQEELEIKKSGQWSSTDPLDFTLSSLQAIDELVYSPYDFDGQKNVEELARSPITSDRIAFACRSELGIYEIEQYLKEVHGERVGVIILERGERAYTLRQVDPFLPKSLEAIYDRLNQLDPAVVQAPGWGGSSDIGGSPRAGGTALTVQQIVQVCRWVLRPPSPARRLAVAAAAVFAPVLALYVLLMVVARGLPSGQVPGLLVAEGAAAFGVFMILLAVLATGTLVFFARGRYALFGVARPVAKDWLALLPVILIGAFAGGAWAPFDFLRGTGNPIALGWAFVVIVAVAVAGAELLFHGVVHGLMIRDFNVSYTGGRWYVSIPNLASAVGYTISLCLLFSSPWWLAGGGAVSRLLGWAVAAMLLALAGGVARERSASLVVAVALHLVAALLAWLIVPLAF